MARFADLEVILQRWDADRYSIEMHFAQPESDADVQIVRGGEALVSIDFEQLRALEIDPAGYGQQLSDSLFASPQAVAGLRQAISTAQTLEIALRLRLVVGASAPELQSLRWETLCDPDDGTPLLTSESIYFSRYLGSGDWRPVKLRPRGPLRGLIVIANPSNLSSYQPGGRQLAPIDVAGELARARLGLGTIGAEALESGGMATLEQIDTRLRAANRTGQPIDVLYLVAHGALMKGEPRIWLENESGGAHVIPGAELVSRLRELQQCPRLVVLVSCQSAGSGGTVVGDGGALAALGPRLAEAGVPAVLAMQGNISMDTMSAFVPAFFSALLHDGLIDRAMAAARNQVRDLPDWWMPVLFMRLKRGGLWYTPGFAGDFEKWPALVSNIRRGQCTPILGPRIAERLLGPPYEIARKWAETYNFPMAPHAREDLPQVAQYLTINQDASFPREELVEYLRRDLLLRFDDLLPAGAEKLPLHALFTTLGAIQREQNESDPYKVLAELPYPIYITADFSGMLADALVAAGKQPVVELCRWNDELELLPSIYDSEPDYRPSPERPLVFHLFGRSQEPESLVVTEDDYFDYLIGVTSNKELIPAAVRRALSDTALLFVGFRMDDWAFRVLFRSIMAQEGGRRRKRYAHVGAQFEPEEGRVLEPERARRYLNDYFQDADISIYWGSVEDFVRELLFYTRQEGVIEQAAGRGR